MKQKIFFLVILLAVTGLVIGIFKMIFGRAPKQGDLRVESTPVSGVFLDNKHIGRTPIGESSFKVEAGEYVLKIVPESTTTQYATWQGKIKIASSQLTYVNASMTESELSSAVDVLWLEKISGKKAEIAVTTTPDSATVMIDDDIKGMTPVTVSDLSPGNHILTVSSQGFVTRTEKVQVTSGYRLVAAIKLALAPGGAISEATSSATTSAQIVPTGSVKPTPKTTVKPLTATADPPKPYALIKDTPTGYLNVRVNPSKTASKTGEVKPGEKYAFDKTASDSAGTIWYEIKIDAANSGWVSGQYITKVE